MRRSIVPLLTAALTALTLTAGATAPALAETPDAALGKTTVVIDPAVYGILTAAGIEVSPTGTAKAEPFMGTVAATFPITKISDSGDRLKHSGGLLFATDDVDILVKTLAIRLDLGKVTANVSGSEVGDAGRVTMFKIVATDDPDLGAVKLNLTDTAADALDATFGADIFSEGDGFGYATPMPKAAS